jgi:hypothetical protein
MLSALVGQEACPSVPASDARDDPLDFQGSEQSMSRVLWSALLAAAGAAMCQAERGLPDEPIPETRELESAPFATDDERPVAPEPIMRRRSVPDENRRESNPTQEFAPALREPERLEPPTSKRRYVVTDRETKAEKQVELRLPDGEIVRLFITSNGAPGDEPEFETVRCSIEASGRSVALWSTRRSVDAPVSLRIQAAESGTSNAALSRASQFRELQIETEGDVGLDSQEHFDQLMQLLQKPAARLLATGFDEEAQWFRQVQRELQRRRRLAEVERETGRLRDQLSSLEDEAQQLSRGEDRTRLVRSSRDASRRSRSSGREQARTEEDSDLRQVADERPARSDEAWEREVRALRREVAELRRQLEALRGPATIER